jgi:bifunctional lysine-specific demethylase and histidyl-hydroxylase NO66
MVSPFDAICSKSFFNEMFETRHGYFPKSLTAAETGDLASTHTLMEMIRTGALRMGDFDVISEGSGRRTSELYDARHVMDVPSMVEGFGNGASLRLFNIHRRFPRVDAVRRNLSDIFGAYCFVNGYLTPKARQGFNPHYDAHEVFILQIAGKKRWTFYDSGPDCPTLPLRHQMFDKQKHLPGSEIETIDVGPGDVLYIPRGRFHSAKALDDVGSFHLTFGVEVNTWTTAILELIEEMTDNQIDLRKAIVPKRGEQAAVREEIQCSLKAFSLNAERLKRVEQSYLEMIASDAGVPDLGNIARHFDF